ncbi:MAG: ABC transporter ATP-binding protein [Verrucomicrobia bacterium]|nr:ABC transporter ATP-binding protein [Verrucomicrobiota bacterium]MBV8484697.1 ABC transporter ATP-binding protein [Verrucomicrobiota bacterium]
MRALSTTGVEAPELNVSSTPAVKASSVSKSFAGSLVIEGINLTVEQGEFIALIGASGCGKTTLLRMCAGLEQPSSGLIEIFGKPPAAATSAHEIGVAFQRPALVPCRTALENVRLTLKITGSDDAMDPLAVLTHFGLEEALNLYPHELSGGMQQRVNIACALVHQPALLLLDEPFGALDEITRERLVDWLAGILRESSRTTILVTHSVEEAVTLSTRVFVMSRRPGRIAAEIKVPLPTIRDFEIRQSEQFLGLVRSARDALHSALAD